MSYNVKCKHYVNGDVQTIVHSRLIVTGKKEKCRECASSSSTGSEQSEGSVDLVAAHERSVQNSMKRALNTIYDISRANTWEYFVTLTFDGSKVDRYNYDDCVKKLSQWLKDCKKRLNHDFKYLVVPERHKDGAYHFHGLFSFCDGLGFFPSGHYTKTQEVIYNVGSYKLGFTTATRVSEQDAVNKYITKYVTKELVESTKGKKKYWASRNCFRPIEETFCFSPTEKNLIKQELNQDARYFKRCGYDIGFERCSSEYYENKGVVFQISDSSMLS